MTGAAGRFQEEARATLREAITAGQADGSVRAGDPALLAATVETAGRGLVLAARSLDGAQREAGLRRAESAAVSDEGETRTTLGITGGRGARAYLRDALLNHGVLVETLETATTWSGLDALHDAVGTTLHHALGAQGTPPLVACHVLHLYPTGASLYFTVLARQAPGSELDQWRAAKVAASEAIIAQGATITHHHAVGRDHAPWLHHETGALGLEALRALKATVDPTGIMNPGKLLPAA